MTVVEILEDESERSASGTLSARSRSYAIRQALDLVAAYRAVGRFPRENVEHEIGAVVTPFDRVAAAITLRVALEAAESLAPILRRVSTTPSFQYRVERTSSVGEVKGRLDVRRYYLDRHRITVPRSYPIRRPTKDTKTPENVLAVLSATNVIADLRWSQSMLMYGEETTDGRAANRAVEELRKLLSLPAFQTIARDPSVRRDFRPDRLIESVTRRLDTNRILHPERYADLREWALAHPGLAGGLPGEDGVKVTASHLGSEFDYRLFELWLLHVVIDRVVARLGPSLTSFAGQYAKNSDALLSWRNGSQRLDVRYQPHLDRLFNDAPRWVAGEKRLDGIPDITLTLSGHSRETTLLIDAKLRQRDGWPSAEIYKMIGYFGNAGQDSEGVGAILYHAPTAEARASAEYDLAAVDSGGRIFAYGIDPTDEPHAANALDAVISALYDRHNGPQKDVPVLVTDGVPQFDDEALADLQQRLAAHTLVIEAKKSSTLEHFEAQLRDLTGGRSTSIALDVREMLTSALMFGQASIGDFDTSGAILSGCNAIEMVVRSRFLAAPSDDPKMLGPLVGVLEQVTQKDVVEMTGRAKECHAFLSSSELAIVTSILADLKIMKDRFRNPSAHEGGRSVTEWMRFFQLVFADNGLLQRLLAEPTG